MDKIRQSPRLLRLIEIAAAWLVTELLVRITGTDAQFQMIDFRLMFVMLIGTVYGLNAGVLSAVLASVSLAVGYLRQGTTLMLLFYAPANWLAFIVYFVVGASCGYVQLRNTETARFVQEENDLLRKRLEFTRKLYQDTLEDKQMFRRQILGRRDSFGKIYAVTQQLDMLQPQEIYRKTVQIMEDVLENHSLTIYRMEKNFFEFYRYEDAIKLTTDPTFDQAKFDSYLETKGSSDHSKLIEMLEKLNDESQPMEKLLETYFDVENIAYWMAFQLLTGNADTQSRNMYLYSPQNSDTWYILDWDNDDMLCRKERELIRFTDAESWEWGISNYWCNVLFRRCLQTASYREALDTAVRELHDYLNADRIEEMTAHYRTITEQYIWQMPDMEHLPLTRTQYNTVAQALPEEIEENYQQYPEGYYYPMPFYIDTPSLQNGVLQLNWDPSYDFDAESITYTVELARDYQFRQVLYRQEHVVLPVAQAESPGAGQYFIRVRATNASGYTQDAFDYYVIDTGKVYGVKCFYIQPDGTVVEDIYEE